MGVKNAILGAVQAGDAVVFFHDFLDDLDAHAMQRGIRLSGFQGWIGLDRVQIRRILDHDAQIGFCGINPDVDPGIRDTVAAFDGVIQQVGQDG